MLFFFFFIKLTGYITYGYLLSRATWRLLSLRASIKLPLHKLALIKRQQTNDSDSKKNGKNKGLKRLLLVLSTFVSFPVSEISDFSGCLEKIGVLTYRLVFDWSQRIIRLLATLFRSSGTVKLVQPWHVIDYIELIMWQPTEWHWEESVRDFSTKWLFENNSVLFFPPSPPILCLYFIHFYSILLREKDGVLHDGGNSTPRIWRLFPPTIPHFFIFFFLVPPSFCVLSFLLASLME